MAKKIIVGNWKMNPASLKEAENLFSAVAKSTSGIKKTEIVVCPPFVYLEKLKKISKKISLGAQDASFTDKGPFTGEVSGEMLSGIGIKYVILGHSERREMPVRLGGGETNEMINKKIKSSISAGLVPILCIGESDRDQNHEYFNVVKKQLLECLKGIKKDLISKIIIAYEPVWAISTTVDRRDATTRDCEEMVIFIRKIISSITSPLLAKKTRILYGGSVTDRDAEDFIKHGGVDGLLVGRASLDSKKFLKILEVVEKA